MGKGRVVEPKILAKGNHLDNGHVKVGVDRAGEWFILKGSTATCFSAREILANVQPHGVTSTHRERIVGRRHEQLLRVAQFRRISIYSNPFVLGRAWSQTEEKGFTVTKVLACLQRGETLRPGRRAIGTENLSRKRRVVKETA